MLSMTTSAKQSLRPKSDDPPPAAPAAAASGQARAGRVRWTIWPLRDRPWSVAFWMLVTIALGLASAWAIDDPRAAVLGLLVLVAVRDLFLPVEYELNAEAVHRVSLGVHRRLPWRSVERYELASDRLVLHLYPGTANTLADTLVVPLGRKLGGRMDRPLKDEVKAWAEYQSSRMS